METDAVRLMLGDVCRELIDQALKAKACAARSGLDYDKGRQFSLYETISLLVQQADAFGIDRSSIGLDEVDPERDLL